MKLTTGVVAGMIDHTNLKAFATEADFRKLCDEAKAYGFKSVAINTYPVSMCRKMLEGSDVLTGGGARSGIWPQILADTTGNRFVLPERDDAALWGTAVIAGKGAGVFPDLRNAVFPEPAQGSSSVVPDPENLQEYQIFRKDYDGLLKAVSLYCGKKFGKHA